MASESGSPIVLWTRLLMLLVLLALTTTCTAQAYGSYSCHDVITKQIVESGSYFDHAFAPFTHPVDPNHWGGHYYNNMNCTYELTAPAGMYIFIEFITFLLDANDCPGDYIKLYLAGSTVRTLCGQPTGYIYDIFTENKAKFTFVSDQATRERGFGGYFASYNPSLKRSPSKLTIEEYRHQVSASPNRRGALGVSLFSRLVGHEIQEVSKDEAAKRSLKISKIINEARSALQEEQEKQAKSVARLSEALTVRGSFTTNKLTFMRHFSLTRDFSTSCGRTCAKVSADLRRYCMETKGLL